MAFKIPVRCGETTTTTGTGTVTTNGAPLQMQTFSAGVGTGNTCPYMIVSGDNVNWERGLGTLTVAAGVTTLARTTVVESSNANAAISLVGTSFVFVCPPGDIANANGLLDQVFGGSDGTYNLKRLSGVWTLVAAGAGAAGQGLWNQVLSATPTRTGMGLTTAVNLGTSTMTDVATGSIFEAQAGSSNDQFHGYSAAYTAPLTNVDLLIGWMGDASSGFGSTNAYVEVGFTDGTKLMTTRCYMNNGNPAFDVYHWTNSTTIGSALVTGSGAAGVCGQGHEFWLRIVDDNTNLKWQTSCDGKTWVTIATEGRTVHMASGPNAWVFGANAFNTNAKIKAIALSYLKS